MEKIKKLKESIAGLNIKKATKKQIEKIICDFGIVYEPRAMYGEWNKYMVKDLGIYQTPGQLAAAVKELLKHEINSYCEVGVYHGGNFLFLSEILKAKNPECICLGIDIDGRFLHPALKDEFTTHIGTSKDLKGHKFDLVHIDADHAYNSVKEDWQNLGQYAKICMFHDINDETVPGVVKFWNEVKQGRKYKEFTYQTDGKPVHGIGLIFNE